MCPIRLAWAFSYRFHFHSCVTSFLLLQDFSSLIILLVSFKDILRKLNIMSRRGDSNRGRRDGAVRRTRYKNSSGGGGTSKDPPPRANARSPPPRERNDNAPPRSFKDSAGSRVTHEKAPPIPVKTYMDWPEERESDLRPRPLSDPTVPVELSGVIGYCSDQSTGDFPGSLVSPSDVQKSIQDAKKFLFSSDLEAAMRSSLTEYTQVS